MHMFKLGENKCKYVLQTTFTFCKQIQAKRNLISEVRHWLSTFEQRSAVVASSRIVIIF